MKNFLFLSLIISFFTIISCESKSPELQKLEARQEVLKQNQKLNKLKIDLEKQKIAREPLQKEADKYNDKAAGKGSDFKPGKTAADGVKNAIDAQKVLRDAEKANKKLRDSNSKIRKIQSEIDKVKSKIDQLEKKIEFVIPNAEAK